MNPYIKSLGSADIMSGSEEKTPTEPLDQGKTPAFLRVFLIKDSSQKRVTEWSQFRKSNEKLLLWMTYIKDKLYLKETLGIEGSEEAVQMVELWTQVLDDLQPLSTTGPAF